MIADELIVSRDYQVFAEDYLGIDLEDYLELIDNYESTQEELSFPVL